jgi:hypothetical protein
VAKIVVLIEVPLSKIFADRIIYCPKVISLPIQPLSYCRFTFGDSENSISGK